MSFTHRLLFNVQSGNQLTSIPNGTFAGLVELRGLLLVRATARTGSYRQQPWRRPASHARQH